MNLSPGFENFHRTFKEGKSQLIWQWVVADLDTPVSAYLKLCYDEDYSFLYESVEGGAILGRYSAIGLRPDLIWRYQDKQVETTSGRSEWKNEGSDALASLRDHIKQSCIDQTPEDLPPMAASGLFGYMGYDMVRLVEDIPDENQDNLGVPDSIMIRPTLMVIFDNVKHMMCLVTPVREHQENSKYTAREVYDLHVNILTDALNKLQSDTASGQLQPGTETSLQTPLEVKSNMSPDDYQAMVKKAVEYINQGDIFQAVLSQRFTLPFDLPSFELYRSLRRLNPSPFLFHLNFGNDFAIVGSSPEILVRVRDGDVTIRPIAGTRKRGKTSAEDKELSEDLLSDPKERAEHLMLLDLGRNDVGRVAETGSVKVTDQFMVELYSHVMHIVSNVEGRLSADHDPLDALFSGFPAGTVSGAPKIRAMEIIDEMEPERRGFYAGCIGYFSGHGDIDTCIALRTALVKDGKIYVQAGAGIVADSEPEAEHQECCNKAGAIIQAAEDVIEQVQLQKRRKAS